MAENENVEGVEPETTESDVEETVAEVEESELDIEEAEDAIVIEEELMTDEDILATFLSAKPVRSVVRVEVEGREGMPKVQMELGSLTDRQIKAIRKAAEKPLNRAQRRAGEEAELDDGLYTRLIVANGTKTPKLNNPDLLKAHKVQRSEQLVEKLFLPGNIQLLFAEVMRVSGYDENAVRVLGE